MYYRHAQVSVLRYHGASEISHQSEGFVSFPHYDASFRRSLNINRSIRFYGDCQGFE